MKLTFLGTGPNQAIPRPGCRCPTCQDARWPNSQTRRTRSSLLIQTRQGNFLIDCSPDFLEQIKKVKISKIDAVFLTHRHQDAVGGLKWLNQWTKQPITVFTEKTNFNYLTIKQFNNLTLKPTKLFHHPLIPSFPDASVGINSRRGQPLPDFHGINIIPFRVRHGLQPIPTLGYLINNKIIYASDFGDLPRESQKLIKNKPIAILDAALYFGRKMKGHLNTVQSIALAQKLKIKKLYLTQVGHSYPSYSLAQRQINQFRKKKYPRTKMLVKLAYDGMIIRDKEVRK